MPPAVRPTLYPVPAYAHRGYVPPAAYFAPRTPMPVTTPAKPQVPSAVSTEAADAPTAPPGDSAATGDRATGDAKSAFVERLLPLIETENRRLLRLRGRLVQHFAKLERGQSPTAEEREHIDELATAYRVDGDPLEDADARSALLERVDALPVSLALAQAANESAWGKSRFAREGNNLFGIWTYDETKGMVPRKRAAGKRHLVRRFDTEAESVRYYMHTLNSHPAYAELRALRAGQRAKGQPLDGEQLAGGLERYSAKGEEYVRLIQAMIRRFDLATYDQAARTSA